MKRADLYQGVWQIKVMKKDEDKVLLMKTEHQENHTLQFRVSTGLKNVLGRELITDDDVAIFELVKNSFDAASKNVYIHFADDSITISDDGIGMSYSDLSDKWLFVAYSSKRNSTREYTSKRTNSTSILESDSNINRTERLNFAGSKGVGRFSSDRLGQLLSLQTRPISAPKGVVHCIDIDWAVFEDNNLDQFVDVNINYRTQEQFVLQEGVPILEHGTVLHISKLQKQWSRLELLKLRSGLAKLINPFGDDVDAFGITIFAKNELQIDEGVTKRISNESIPNTEERAQVVNGRVGNFIFSTLQEKTTFIQFEIDPTTNTIETKLTDRGEEIYRIRESNPFTNLHNSFFRCQIFSLNRAAKATFARRMGLPSIQFGSIFLFRNGYRVFPIGDSGDDWFGIDRRKQQGYARYLGTRDVIGRIDVSGNEDKFTEASSRNQGLISTPAVEELKKCFWEYGLKRLERYVVPVSWGTKDVESETLSFLENDKGRARVSAAVANLIGSEDVEVLAYSRRLIKILNERSDQFESSLTNLKLIANRTNDTELGTRIEEAGKRFIELKQAEADARRLADSERQAKLNAQARANAAIAEVEEFKQLLNEEKKRNLFLVSVTSLDVDTVQNLHHSITGYAVNLQMFIKNLMAEIGVKTEVPRETVLYYAERIAFLNQKVLAVARFATKANFRMESDYTENEEDLADYIVSYINTVAKDFLGGNIDIHVDTDRKVFLNRFKPIDVSIVVDNLVSNSYKSRSTRINFDLKQSHTGLLEILVFDDGKGLSKSALFNNQLFDKGFTTTDGSGLGLYHVKQVLNEMGATIEVVESKNIGATFLIKVQK